LVKRARSACQPFIYPLAGLAHMFDELTPFLIIGLIIVFVMMLVARLRA
jgi:hypothetical protein